MSHLEEDDPSARYATQQVAQLRQRLLDLTKRNPLLNYRFRERARGQVRVIDELPDHLYGHLAEDGMLWFRPLDEPEGEPKDEKSPEFEAAFQAARLADNQYLEEVDGLEEEDAEDPTFRRIERALKDRVRESLGMPPRPDRETMSRAEIARIQGLDPTYELPATNDEQVEARHEDNEIQTLLFPDEMERKLSQLRDITRRGIEETGLNTLFAAYGYLEWYEDERSDVKLYAPLLLQPLDLTRKARRDTYRYGIKNAGEDPQVNLTLVERMKDLHLVVPALDEDELPDSYMRKMNEAITEKPRWRVRRFIAIGTFAYGKLAMWHDLNPDHWPPGQGPGTSKVVRDLLAGSGAGGGDAPDHDVDSPDFESRLPLLVADADASQLSAVIDAVEGHSLAIKGPPGTGKSQTITNLIAASLAKGKKVLFLAEKMAALEVVKNRLDKMELGAFVLELHSTKSRKKDVLAGIAQRLDLGHEPPPEHLEGTSAELKRLRRQLTSYADLLNQQVGRSGKTLHEAFWAEARTRDVPLPQTINRVSLANVDQFGVQDIQRCKGVMASLEKSWKELTTHGTGIASHPWRGVHKILPQFEHDSIFTALSKWNSSLIDSLTVVHRLSAACGFKRNSSQEDIATLITHLESLPRSSDPAILRVPGELVVVLGNPPQLEGARELDTLWRTLAGIDEELDSSFIDASVGLPSEHALRGVVASSALVDAGAITVGEVGPRVELVRKDRESWSDAEGALSKFASTMGLPNLDARSDVLLVERGAKLSTELPRAALAALSRTLCTDEAIGALREARERAAKLRETFTSIKQGLEVDSDLTCSDLLKLANTLENTGLISRIFSSQYKEAKARHRGMSGGRRVGRRPAAAHLRRYAAVLGDITSFGKDARIRELLGPTFTGYESDFIALNQAHAYGLSAREIGREGGVGSGVRDYLMAVDLEGVSQLRDLLHGHEGRLLEQCVEELDGSSRQTMCAISESRERAVGAWSRLHEALLPLQLEPRVSVRGVGGIADQLEKRSRILERDLPDYSSAIEVLAILGFDREGPEERGAALRLVDQLSAPEKIVDASAWNSCLMVADLPTKLGQLDEMRLVALNACENLTHAWRDVRDLTLLNPFEVFNSPTIRDAQLQVQLDWGEAALGNRDSLGGWTAWLRARARAADENLTPIVQAFDDQGSFDGLVVAFDRVIWRSLIRNIFDEHPELQQFSGLEQEEARKRFRKLDSEMLLLNRQQLRSDLLRAEIPAGQAMGPRRGWTGLALLRHHSALQRPRITIRRLVEGGHEALLAIKPCWMMSPG